MKIHPLFEAYFLSGTETLVKDVEYTFDEWMHRKVWRVQPLEVTKLTPHFLDLYSLLREEGFIIDRITGSFCPPKSKVVYRAFSTDINDIVYTLCYVPLGHIASLFYTSDTEHSDSTV